MTVFEPFRVIKTDTTFENPSITRRNLRFRRVPKVLEVRFGEELLIRIRHKIYEIAGLGALLSEVMRRLCVVRSEGVPPESSGL